MATSFRPLMYTWAAILAGLAGGAVALQIIGPPHPRPQAISDRVVLPSDPPSPGIPAIAPAASDAAAAPPPASTAAPAQSVSTDPAPASPSAGPASNEDASTPPAAVPAALSQAVPTTQDRSAGREPVASDIPIGPAKRSSPERRRPIPSISAKPLPQESVSERKPGFIGVFVTQADGTRVFKAQQ